MRQAALLTLASTFAWVAVQPRVEAFPTYRLYGLNFSPYVDGQNPNYGSYVSVEQLRARMSIIAPYTNWIRTFGCTHGLELSGQVAREFDLQAAIGAWLSQDPNANAEEIANLIAVANAGQADIVIVGSEVLLRGDMSPDELVAQLNYVRAHIPPGIPVTTADVYGELLAHPDVMAACDVVFANYYAYWQGMRVDVAMAALYAWHQQVVAAAPGKTVFVSEAGWPSCGNTIDEAVPSPQNAAYYFLDFASWARATGTPYFYFEAFDESWKAPYEGPQGACWGVWTKDGILKPDMQAVFDGQSLPDNWTVPGGPGTPDIVLTHLPPIGSYDNLRGRVWHVSPADCNVVVYIYVPGALWWIKPTFANPLTPIQADGRWTCDVTTGGNDALATRIAAFLIPASFDPPHLGGAADLPAVLYENSLDWVIVPRPLLGDLDCTGVVDFDDINPFVLALSNPAGYAAAYPDCAITQGDCNQDGSVNFDDINPFVALLSGGD